MASSRPTALILAAALSSAPIGTFLTAGVLDGAREGAAQQVSSARFVPTAVPAAPSAPAAPAAVPAPARGVAPIQASPPAAGPAPVPTARTAATQPGQPAGAAARPAPPAGTGLAGRVTGNSSPLAAAGVYAYQLADLALFKVLTDPQGNFLFRDLPAGLYKIIAHKPGFEPVVIMVTRTTAKAYQFLELQLAQRRLPNAAKAAKGSAATPATSDDRDFWTLRAGIPPDVLRDIEAADAPAVETKAARAAQPEGAGGSLAGGGTVSAAALSAASDGRLHTTVQAMTGVANVAPVGAGQVSTGQLGIAGQLGQVLVGLSGRFWQMSSDSPFAGTRSLPGLSGDGKTSAVSLALEAGPSSTITVTSLNNHLVPRTQAGQSETVGLDHYQVKWSQALGDNSHSDFAAQYTSENNYHRLSAVDPVDIPDASRTWNVEGSYTTALGDSGTLQTGFRYTENQLGLVPLTPPPGGAPANPRPAPPSGAPASDSALSPNHQTVDVFARGGTRLQPAFMVEYGLYTTLMHASVSLTPH